MNHDVLVQCGRLPWSPNPAVRDLDIWHGYEHPIAGTFRCGADPVFFAQIVGFNSRLSVWAYGCLTDQELAKSRDLTFSSPADVLDLAYSLLSERKVVLALADDQLTEHWSVSDDDSGPLAEQIDTFLNRVIDCSKPRDTETMLRAKLAQVDVVTAELVEA